MIEVAFTALHSALIRNGFGFYLISFISMLVYQGLRGTLSINVIELVGHLVLLLIMGRLVLLVTEASTLPAAQTQQATSAPASTLVDSLFSYTGLSTTTTASLPDEAAEVVTPSQQNHLANLDFVTIGLIFCFASNIASFLFGLSLGRQLEDKDGLGKEAGSEPKKRWLDRRFVIKPKGGALVKVPSGSSSSSSSSSCGAQTPAATSLSSAASSSSHQSLNFEVPSTVSPSMRNGNAIKLYTQRSKSRSDQENLTPMEITMEKAKQTILSILHLTDQSRYRDLPMMEIRNASHQNGLVAKLFTTSERTQGIYLTGSCHTYLSPETVLSWLKQNGFTTGFEGLAPEQEISLQQKSKKMEITVRRLVSKPASMMSSKRDFVVVTSISKLEEAGAYIVASRSMPEDFANLASGAGQKKRGGCLRGIVYGAGWILHPWHTGEGDEFGCEVSYAAHVDMMGAASSNVNVNKQEILADRTLGILNFLCETEDPSNLRLKPESGGISAPSPLSSPRRKSHPDPEPEPELVDDGLNSAITAENRSMLLSVAKDALARLKRLHSTYRSPASTSAAGGSTPPSSKAEKESWDVFYDQAGVTVRELKNNSNSTPVGVLSATCSTEAPPHVVRQLLMNHPKEVDALLEGRTILSKLDQQSYIQWLAYGTIWPIGARDFLLVTTEDVFDERTGDGFVIASTSIDHLCELEGEVVKGETNDTAEPSYTRSSLKLAGYVGVPNASGGTDVSMFVDVDVYSYIPAWLLQVLAQYGLSEMMSRIQRATMGHPQLSFRNDISRMLSRIETTEAKMRSFVQDHGLPVPKEAAGAFLFMDGGNGDAVGRASIMGGSPASPASPLGGMADHSSMSTPGGKLPRGSHRPSTMPGSASGLALGAVVPTVEEAAHKRLSIRRASVVGNAPLATGSEYEEFFARSRDLAVDSLHLMRVYLGLEQQRADEAPLGLDWQQKKKEKTTTVYGTAVAGNTWNAVRAVGVVRADKEDILKLLIDDKRIGEFDDMFDSCTFLYKADEKVAVRRMAFKAIWPTAPREFLVCSTYEAQQDGSVLVCTRSPEPDVSDDILPPTEGYVRGRLQISGYYIQPYASLSDKDRADVPQDGCRVTLTAHSELGGTLPSSIINMLSTAAPMKILASVAKILEKEKKR